MHVIRTRLRERFSKITRATGDIQNLFPFKSTSKLHDPATPSLIKTERMKSVVQVITPGDGREHPLNLSSLVLASMGI